MQRRKPTSPKHQARRRGALERLEARIARQPNGPDARQAAERDALRSILQLTAAAA